MKRIILLLCIGSIFLLIFLVLTFIAFDIRSVSKQLLEIQSTNSKSPSEPIRLTPTAKLYPTIQADSIEPVSYSLNPVLEPYTVLLIPNFSEKVGASSVREKNGCTFLTSGGFYTDTNAPIGLFSVLYNQIQIASNNELFNGYVWSETGSDLAIQSIAPQQRTEFAFQTGPLLYKDGEKRVLLIKNDELDRRIILISTSTAQINILILFSTENSFKGPYLKDVPELIYLISQKETFIIRDAINLDGGSHSAFYTPDSNFGELLPVGSFLCFRQTT